MRKEILEKLQEPFDDGRIKFKLQSKSSDGRYGLFVPYVDARDVIERLNATGAAWSDEYELAEAKLKLPNGSLVDGYMASCKLTVDGTTRQDVGEGDTPKAAVSDALKRAAVKFGLGLHLYSGNRVWSELDDRGYPVMSHEEMLKVWRGEAEAAKPKQASAPSDVASSGGTPRAGGGGRPATEKQIKFVRMLAERNGLGTADADMLIEWYAEKNDVDQLTSKLASELIDVLKDKEQAKELIETFQAESGAGLF